MSTRFGQIVPFQPSGQNAFAQSDGETNIPPVFTNWISMRITCPSCAAEYEVPAPRLSSDKRVRCARCRTEWRLPPEEAGEVASGLSADPPPVHAAVPSPPMVPDRPPASMHPGHTHTLLRAAWVLSVVILVTSATAIVHWRSDIIHIWPPSARILALLDAPPAETDAPGREAAK